jgi:hypothetical protein
VRTRPFRPLPLCALIIPLVLFRCIRYEYSSRWLDRVIAIDGSDKDWQGATVYVEKANVSVGMFNDSESMTLCLVTTDRRIGGRIMRGGMRLWFDPNGGQKKTFGIHFPVGIPGSDPGPGGSEGESPGLGDESPNPFFLDPQTDMEFLGPGKGEIERIPVQEARGIQVKAAVDSGRFVYELKVPLIISESTPHAVGIQSKKQVAIGFEIEDFSPAGKRGRMGERMGSGGMGMPSGGMGGGSGMSGGRDMEGGPDSAEPGMDRAGADRFAEQKQVNLWILVNLASPNSSGGR